MNRPDPFTHATTSECNFRQPTKTGDAFEVSDAPPSRAPLVVFLGVLLVIAGLAALRLGGFE